MESASVWATPPLTPPLTPHTHKHTSLSLDDEICPWSCVLARRERLHFFLSLFPFHLPPPCDFTVKWTNSLANAGPRAHACQSGPRRYGSISTLCWNNPHPPPACLPACPLRQIDRGPCVETPLVTGIKKFDVARWLIELRELFCAERGLEIKSLARVGWRRQSVLVAGQLGKNDVSRHDSPARANEPCTERVRRGRGEGEEEKKKNARARGKF